MAMIFDNFPDERAAERFAEAVQERFPGKKARVFLTVAAAIKADPFPFDLTAPIVHVTRGRKEKECRQLVKEFGGEFAGT